MNLGQLDAELKYAETQYSRHWINKNKADLENTTKMQALLHTKIAEQLACESEARKNWSRKLG